MLNGVHQQLCGGGWNRTKRGRRVDIAQCPVQHSVYVGVVVVVVMCCGAQHMLLRNSLHENIAVTASRHRSRRAAARDELLNSSGQLIGPTEYPARAQP